jgi:hypothetical protein
LEVRQCLAPLLALASPGSIVPAGSAPGTLNSGGSLSVHVGSVTVDEGQTASFRLTLCNAKGAPAASGYPVTVYYQTRDGTAKAGVNYTSASGSVVIPAGSTGTSIAVATKANDINGPDETFSLVLEGAGHGTAHASATATIKSLRLSLANVEFLGAYPVTPDPTPAMVLSPLPPVYPQWQAAAGGGPATAGPVWYQRGATPRVSVELVLNQDWSGTPIYVWAQGTDNVTLASQRLGSPTAAGNGSLDATASLTASGPLPNYVLDDPSFQLHWYAAFRGAAATDLGATSDELYLSYAAPLPGTYYQTDVWLGCRAAAHDQAQASVFNDIENEVFAASSVQTHDGTPLYYYQRYDTSDTTTATLLANGDGQCGAWAHLMQDVLAAQGIATGYVTVEPSNVSAALGRPENFLINDWQFGAADAASVIPVAAGAEILGANGSPLTVTQENTLLQQYSYIDVAPPGNPTAYNTQCNGYQFDYADVTDLSGLAGKGPNPNPASMFRYHQFIAYTDPSGLTTWYDPSYGTSYSAGDNTNAGRLLAFQNQDVAGYYVTCTAQVDQSYLASGDHNPNDHSLVWATVYLIRKPAGNGQIEVQAAVQ